MKLDIGCGKHKKKGFYGIDQFKAPGVDKVVNIDQGFPFKENSVEEIYTSHVLEHVENLEFVLEEIHRICKANAKILIKVPHFSGKSAFYEFHKRFFRFDSFEEYGLGANGMNVSSKNVVFKIVNKRLNFLKKYYYPLNPLISWMVNSSKRIALFYEESCLRNIFPAHEVEVELRVVK